LNHSQRVSARHGLACYRMSPESVVTDLAQPHRPLNGAHRSPMTVHVPREVACLGKQKLLSRVALLNVPPNGFDHVLRKLECVGFLVLSIDNLRWTCLGTALQSAIDDELRRDLPKSAPRRPRGIRSRCTQLWLRPRRSHKPLGLLPNSRSLSSSGSCGAPNCAVLARYVACRRQPL